MIFVLQKSIKGQALADFLTAHPVSKMSKLSMDIPDEVIETNMTSEDDICSCSLMVHQEQSLRQDHYRSGGGIRLA